MGLYNRPGGPSLSDCGQTLLVWAEKKLPPSQAKETKMERADDVRGVLKTPAQFSLFEATF